MHWVIQENFANETGWDVMVDTLGRFSIPYSLHKVIPFIGELEPDPVLDTNNVICIGSYSMRHIANKKGWSPGVFDLFDQNFNVQKQHWGDLMLNFDSKIYPFGKVPVFNDERFIRPIDDSKYFAGGLFYGDDFGEWQFKVCDLKLDFGNSLTSDTLVQVSTPKEIYAEYRFWIVDGRIVTASLYKRGDKVIYDPEVDERFYHFVSSAIQPSIIGWRPHVAFVIDVCDTPNGIKIVEINTINSSGFYAGDVQKLVLTLDAKFSE
jgi:hypothetical protein